MKKLLSLIIALLFVASPLSAGPPMYAGSGQALDPTASPTFVGETLTGLTASKPVFTDAGKALTSSGTVPVNQGGTGATSLTDGGILVGAGTGAVEVVPVGLTTEILVGGGAATNPVWTTATGTAAPVRAGSPGLTGSPTNTDANSVVHPLGYVSSVAKSSAYTILDNDTYQTIFVSGNTTIKLPVASKKRLIKFKKIDINTTMVVIQKSDTGSDTIEGENISYLIEKYDSLILESDGTATWYKF